MLPAGFYRAKALPATAQWGVSPNKGTDFIRLMFQVSDGEHSGATVTWDGYFAEGSAQRVIDSLRHAGCTFPGNDVTNLEGLGSTDVSIDVEHESYEKDGQTKTFARVAWVNSMNRGIKPELQMDTARKQSFKERMMGAVVLAKQPKSAPTEQQATGTDGKKLPF